MQEIILIAHNIRSTYNVGSINRTAECFRVSKIYATGYTPFTEYRSDPIVAPHVRSLMTKGISKTSLGAEKSLPITQYGNIHELIRNLKENSFVIAALEQSNNSVDIRSFKVPSKLALILGTETTGVQKELQNEADYILEIPMLGQKESLNLASATAIALFELQRNNPSLLLDSNILTTDN